MEVPWRDRRPAPRGLLIAALGAAVLTALCVLVVDQPLARWIAQYEASAVWNRGIELLEWTIGLPFFKLFASVLLVTGMVATAAIPRWRGHAPAWMLMAATHVICRFLTVWIKDATGRPRPHEWLAQGGDATFGRDGIAFPSGHVVLFASLVIPLAVLVPRTRPLLAVAAFVMAARLAVNAHFASDVIGAITLVTLVAWAASVAIRPLRTERPRASRR
ncbi:MAG: phosphatase PAP2 family protein [Myxococcota bacterium]|nr:phosphatase PAP2 family protein [Myxococcota bacterium]